VFKVNFEHVPGPDETTSGPQDFFDFLAFSAFFSIFDSIRHAWT